MTTTYRSTWQIPMSAYTPELQHKFLWRAFPNQPNGGIAPFRFRVEKDGRTTVISDVKPSQVDGCMLDVSPYAPDIKAGEIYIFTVKANVTKATKWEGSDIQHRGRRITVYEDNEIVEWVRKKISPAGELLAAHVLGQKQIKFYKAGRKKGALIPNVGDESPVTLAPTEIVGVVEVKDPAKMKELLVKGVGSAKGFGMGLVVLTGRGRVSDAC